MKKVVDTIIVLSLSIFLPLVFRPSLFLSWPIWVATMAGAFLSLSQPSFHIEKENIDVYDQSSLRLILFAVLLCFAVPITDYGYGKPRLINTHQVQTWIGLSLIVSGFLFRYWSIQILGRYFTTKVQIQSDHKLITEGPYRYLRHPSYLGAWLGVLGVSIFFQSFWGVLTCLLFYFPAYIYRISCEEKALITKFGNLYGEYQKKTWRLFPYLF